ncbi:MAG: AAA family ATPase, partial [Candidatus Bathyarchaeia archaeon]
MGLVVTVSGLHGTGKSTYARALSEAFDLRHVSAGGLFRQIALERGLSIG